MSYQQANNQLLTLTNSAVTQTALIDCTQLDTVSIQAVYTNGTTAAKTFASGVVEVDTFTLPSLVGAADGDYMTFSDVQGLTWAVALDTTGNKATTPTGAAWVAIPTAQKVYLNVSATSTATTVATAVQAGAVALTGETTYNTTTNSNATVINTQVFAGVVTAPNVYSATGAAGSGSITVTQTHTGTASTVNPFTNTISITAHGQTTGSAVVASTSSALPSPLTATTYYVIYVDANTIQLATTLAHAVSGTAIVLTTSGVGTQTLTPSSLSQVLKVSVSNDPVSPTNWTDIPGTTATITGAGNTYWTTLSNYSGESNVILPQLDVTAKWMRVLLTPTTGQLTGTVTINSKSTTRN